MSAPRRQLLPKDRVPICLVDKSGTKATLVTMTGASDKLYIAVHERGAASAPSSRGAAATTTSSSTASAGTTRNEPIAPLSALGKQLLFVPIDDVVNIESEAERRERQATRKGEAASTVGGDVPEREMAVGCFGSLTSIAPEGGASAAPAGSGGSGSGIGAAVVACDDTYYLSFLPEKSKEATVKFLRFRVDVSGAAGPSYGAVAGSVAGTSAAGPRAAMRDICADVLRRVYPTGPRHITAFVSPVSGKGAAQKMWETVAVPILRCTRHTITPIVTQYARHAEEVTYGADLSPADVYVAVGGDGMVHEVVNGFLRRRADKGEASVPEGFLIALLPAGSGCALAKTLNVLSPLQAAMGLVHLRSVAIDMMRMEFLSTTKFEPVLDGKGKKTGEEREVAVPVAVPDRYAFLSASFAITNEIDKGSEKYRWMGNARFTFYTVKMLLGTVPTYRCEVRYVPWTDPNPSSPLHEGKMLKTEAGSPVPKYPACTFATGTCPQCNHNHRVKEACTAAAPVARETERTADEGSTGATTGFKDEEWVTVSDSKFAFLMVCNIPYIAQDMHCAPFAHMSDGALDLVYIAPKRDGKTGRELPIEKASFVSVFLDIESGKHVTSPDVKYIKARAVEIVPHDGITMADGEVVPSPDMPLAGIRVTPVHRAVSLVRGVIAE